MFSVHFYDSFVLIVTFTENLIQTRSPILASLSLDFPESRRTKLDFNFLYYFFNNNIDCPEFLEKFNFHVPVCSTRSHTTFLIMHQKFNYALNTLSNRLMCSVNLLKIDIFSFDSLLSLKHHVSNVLH